MDPLITIIMPSLNVAPYIEKSVRSVMSQTMKELEILCIDAGSTDGTLEILQNLANEDKRIQVIHSDQRSYGYQVNLGIRMARGKYIAILETDDYVETDMYGRLYQEAENNYCDFVKADYIAFWKISDQVLFSRNRHILAEDKSLYNHVINPQEQLGLSLKDCNLWTGIYRTDFLRGHQIHLNETPGAAFQDVGFMLQTHRYAERVMYINQFGYHYCIDREGASSNVGKSWKFIYDEYRIGLEQQNLDESYLKQLYLRMLSSFYISGKQTITGRLDATQYHTYIYWIIRKLRMAIDHKIIDSSIVPSDVWQTVCLFLNDFTGCLNQFKKMQKDFEQKLFTNEVQNPLVIFGCGDIGNQAYHNAESHGWKVYCFVDNDRNLWNMQVHEVPVCDPNQCQQFPSETVYLIANELHEKEIRIQMQQLGVQEDHVFSFAGI